MRFIIGALVALLLSPGVLDDDHSTNVAKTHRFLLIKGKSVLPPEGWVEFCKEQPAECKLTTASISVSVKWPHEIEDQINELEMVNSWVNRRINPAEDKEHYSQEEKWTYPEDGYGDCEDVVLFKRLLLMQMGWPRSSLLITVVIDKEERVHAVLTVRTADGDYFLDNQTDKMLLAHNSGYRLIKIQSPDDPNRWVAVN